MRCLRHSILASLCVALAAVGCSDDTNTGKTPTKDAAADSGGPDDRLPDGAMPGHDAAVATGDAAADSGNTQPDIDAANLDSGNADAGNIDSGADDSGLDSSVPDTGVDAADPYDGNPMLLSRDTELPPDCDCELGAVRTETGLDDGAEGTATALDGVLAATEVDDTQTVCRTEVNPDRVLSPGLTTLPINTCVPPTGPSHVEGVDIQRVFDKVKFPVNAKCVEGVTDTKCDNAFRPTAMVQHPTSNKFYVVEQTGRVLAFGDSASTTTATVALDIEDKVISGYEPGLLNLDFDPNNPDYAYASYITCVSQLPNAVTDDSAHCTDGEGLNDYVVVSRFHLDAGGVFERASERVIIQAAKERTEHNGAGGRFGPDGNLFVAWGDGGGFPPTAPQNPLSLLGKILRIRVNDSGDMPYQGVAPRYTIPTDNPYVGSVIFAEEIYAIGFRNPWRFDFDPHVPASGLPSLWVGDVGLVTAEEIDHVEAGKNYGWPIMEGEYCRPVGISDNQVTVLENTTCNNSGVYATPAFSYKQGFGVTVTGGFAYRGSALSSLGDSYVFADFSLGTIWALDPNGSGGYDKRWLFDTNLLIPTFAQGNDGELYVFDWFEGGLYKLVPVDSSHSKPAQLLSQTGCVDPLHPKQPAAGVLPYSINTPFFSEAGICKTRWMYLPDAGTITEYATTGSLIFQPGTAFVKNFDAGGKRIETRILYMHSDYGWSGWSYRWNDEQTDAVLLDKRVEESFGDIDWMFPDNGDCQHCHTNPAGRILGARIEQLNKLSYFPATNRWANTLDTLRSLNMIQRVIAPDPSMPIGGTNQEVVPLPAASTLPHFPKISDESASLNDRVKAYFHSNCSHCHRPAGDGRGDFSLLQEDVLDPQRGPCNKMPQSGVYDDPMMRVIAPGDRDHSMILKRMLETKLPYGMHPYRASVDQAGVDLIGRWIDEESENVCNP